MKKLRNPFHSHLNLHIEQKSQRGIQLTFGVISSVLVGPPLLEVTLNNVCTLRGDIVRIYSEVRRYTGLPRKLSIHKRMLNEEN